MKSTCASRLVVQKALADDGSCVAGARGGGEERTSAADLAIDERQFPLRTVISEEPFSAAHDDRVDHQPELIDEVVLE
jgi:hypothetical protein